MPPSLLVRFPTASICSGKNPPLEVVKVTMIGEDRDNEQLATLPQLFPPPISQEAADRIFYFHIAIDQLQALVVAVVVAAAAAE